MIADQPDRRLEIVVTGIATKPHFTTNHTLNHHHVVVYEKTKKNPSCLVKRILHS